MNIRYRVELSEVERGELRAMLSGGKHAARKLKRAQILLAADAGVADETLAISLDVGVSTVSRVKRRLVEGGVAGVGVGLALLGHEQLDQDGIRLDLGGRAHGTSLPHPGAVTPPR